MTLHVSVEGIIGCGKTTLLDELEKRGFLVVREEIGEWTELLNHFYQDQKRWALTLQTKIFMHFCERLKQLDAKADVVVWERSHVSNVDIFYELLCQMKAVNPLERGVFSALCRSMRWNPDHVVYLRLDPSTAMERIEARNGKEDLGVTWEYQDKLAMRHDEVLALSGAHVVDASMDQVDVVSHVVDFLANLRNGP